MSRIPMGLLRGILAIVVGLAFGSLALGQSFPGGQQILPPGGPMRDCELADLDGDGKVDAIVAAGKVAVLLGNGSGFGAPTLFDAASAPGALAIGDFNGDAIADVVASGAINDVLSLLPGIGGGALGAPAWFTTGIGNADSLVAADFDLDGKLDFVEGSRQANAIRLFTGTGLGTFNPGSLVSCGTAPVDLIVGDWNGDGKADLAFGNNLAETARIVFGDGAGGFGAPAIIGLPGRPLALAAADLDADGDVDLAVTAYATFGPATLTILANAGGAFSLVSSAVTDMASALAAADLDGDGRADLVSLATFGMAHVFLAGAGPGISLAETPAFPARGEAIVGFLRDIDGDSIPDLVASGGGAVSWFRGAGGGIFVSITVVATPATTMDPTDCIARDFNGDGAPDAAMALGDGRIANYRNSAGALALVQTPSTAPSPLALVAGDWNGDGHIDLATANQMWSLPGDAISALLGTPSGLFGHTIGASGPVGASGLAAADMDLDGKLDLVTFHTFFQSGIGVWRGVGNGSFKWLGLNAGALGSARGVVFDVDMDGKPDVVSTSSSGLLWRRGNGDGTIQGEQPIASTIHPNYVAVDDLDGDGRPDLVAVDDGAQILLGNGAGGFSPQPPFAAAAGASCATIADVDGDGRADLLTIGHDGSATEFAVNLGLGGAAFSALTRHPILGNPPFIRAADLDLDGRIDAIASLPSNLNTAPSFLGVLRNLGVAAPGITNYGAGTSGCRGRIALSTAGAPAIPSPGFGLIATNTPPSSLGLGLVADAQDLAGSDPFAIGALLHVDLFLATQVVALDFVSREGSTAFAPAPIPASSFLAGSVFYGQGLFLETLGQKCTTSQFGLVSSVGVRIQIP